MKAAERKTEWKWKKWRKGSGSRHRTWGERVSRKAEMEEITIPSNHST